MTRHASVLVVTLSLAIGSATLPAPALAQTVAAADATPQWAVPDEDGLSLRNIVAEAFSDLTRLPSWETATILSIGGVGAVAGHRWDRDMSASMATSRDLGRALNAGGTLGSMQMQAAAAFATYAIQDKRHYLSDVAFGAALGIVAGRSVTVGSGSGRFAIAPAPAPGGGGVSVTWLGAR